MAEELLASKGIGRPEISMQEFCKQVIDDPQRFASNNIIKVVHRKRVKDSENEFLVVYVTHSNSMATLCVERGISTVRPASYSHSSKPLGSDRVSYWTDPPPSTSTTLSTYEIGTLRCREPIKLRNFCLVLRTVYTAKPSYELPAHQSFVFCFVLMKVMEEELDVHQLDRGEGYDRGGTFGGVKVLDGEIAVQSMQDFRDQAEKNLEEEMEQAIIDSIERVRRTKEKEQLENEQAQADALTALMSKTCKIRAAEEEAAQGVLTKIGERVQEKLALDKMDPVSRAMALAVSSHLKAKSQDSVNGDQHTPRRLNPGGGWERDEARETWSAPHSLREAYAGVQSGQGNKYRPP